MAVTLLQVLVLGVIAAATDDVPITWLSPPRALVPCVVPDADRIHIRRPPPPLAADDRPKPRQPYVWRKGDTDLKLSRQSPNYNLNVLNNGTLEVRVNKKERNNTIEGVYQCSVRHSGGVVLGYPVHLKLAYLDRFSVHPSNSTAWVGQPHVLRCDIKSGPAVTVSWLRDRQPLPSSDRYHMLQNHLLILDVEKEDAGLYKCRATNTYAKEKTRTSQGGRLHVKVDPAAVGAEPYLLPVLQQSNITVSRGETVVLACPVVGFPKPKLTWKVTHRGERTAELGHTGEVLTLTRLRSSDDGLYTCHVEGRSDLAKTFNVSTYVPVNITIPPTSSQALQASTVRFNCTAVGYPTPNITWYKDGKPLTLTGTIVMTSAFGDKRMELLIRSVTSEDAGVYQCFAHNGHSTASAWAVLGVASPGAMAPSGVKCWPVGAKHVLVRWPEINGSLAYTVQVSSPGGASLPNQPQLKTEEIIPLDEALTPYKFQVRGYVLSTNTGKSVASDISESVTCQGQGVPIKFSRLNDGILVSWKNFLSQTPGVKQWILQYKAEDAAADSEPYNVTLGPEVTNYTISTSYPELQVRLLGTTQIPWLQQNLTLVPWRSTVNAEYGPESGVVTAKIKTVEITDIEPRTFTVRWRCDAAEETAATYEYKVCTTKLDEEDEKEECFETDKTQFVVDGLMPGTEYSVRVRATIPSQPYLVTEFSQPIQVGTPIEDVERIKDLTYKVINSSAIRVYWNSEPDNYTIYYNVALSLPISLWPSVQTVGNTVLITGVNTLKPLYVMVSGYDPLGHSAILKIPARVPDVRDLQWTFTSTGLTVKWKGEGPRVVRYSQNDTLPKEQWASINATTNSVQIPGVNKSEDVYVIVSALEPLNQADVLHIPSQVSQVPDLQYTFSRTGLTITWQGDGPRVVHYSQNLTQPLDQWPTINVTTNTVHIPGLNKSKDVYVIVSARELLDQAAVLHIPSQGSQVPGLQYTFSRTGLTVTWQGDGPRVVHYSQNLTQPLYQWPTINVTTNTVHIPGVDKSKDVYVIVSALEPLDQAAVLHIPVQVSQVSNLQYTFSRTGLTVTWQGDGPRVVHYSQNLTQPLDQWPTINVTTNTVHIPGVDKSKDVYVMVSALEPLDQAAVLHIPGQVSLSNLQYTFSRSGLIVTWQGDGPRVVHYSQNLTQPLDQWPTINVTTNTVHITGLESSLMTHLVLTAPGQLQPFSVPTRPVDTGDGSENSWYYCVAGITCGVLVLCALATIFCFWHRRKRAHMSARLRRRNVSPTEGHEGDVAEMKNVSSQLANGGGSKDAGEPLLNGHVHITENPNQSKTPNGRMRRGLRYEPSFDVARYEDPDITLETVLDDTSTTTYNLLDTSRRPEFDLSRSSRDISTNNSFNKLPDDNMNSELTRSTDFQLDNSKILPTLQPNG